ncbi:PAAR domain-containing protein [Pseudomonas sp. 148P]|uniref:PAAR domain-containing protein n=1 Tax=Pseudomonas ulcerans TaxID=3115852 RepID=A0ABU7HQV4_9PSED|nr:MULTISPECIES: PAAR domain-containing protein [unclassified Pseudomonas]MEE1922946.1 PAAR domain-containing protein [Pseudomonas sp. 147P]MEE1933908.1 PAAR domain-containing protein [Pseudomonas sp. 148P]
MKPLIRLGDTLHPYGGEVLQGRYDCDGKPVACEGDRVRCNLHGLTAIAEGSSLMTMDDLPVALHGHRCNCGCSLVSSMPDTLVDL